MQLLWLCLQDRIFHICSYFLDIYDLWHPEVHEEWIDVDALLRWGVL